MQPVLIMKGPLWEGCGRFYLYIIGGHLSPLTCGGRAGLLAGYAESTKQEHLSLRKGSCSSLSKQDLSSPVSTGKVAGHLNITKF